jgi:hypothetical protein
MMIIIYLIFMGFIKNLSENYIKKVSIYRLGPGAVLAEGILKSGITAPFRKHSREQYVLTKTTPLDEEEVLKIHSWHKQGKLHFNKIAIHQTMIFAPHIFLGVLITIICQGNVVLFLKAVFGI